MKQPVVFDVEGASTKITCEIVLVILEVSVLWSTGDGRNPAPPGMYKI